MCISIRITYGGKRRYYTTGHTLTEAELEKVMDPKARKGAKLIALELQAFEKKASDVIDELSPSFSFDAFEKAFLTNRISKQTITHAFKAYSDTLREEERIGTAVSYECAGASFKKFSPDTRFSEVTPDFLRRYEKWMLKAGNSISTVGIYARSLRTIFNIAISEKMISKDAYPFCKRKYEIPTGKNIKKAITLEEIKLIFGYTAERGSTTEKSKDYWIFMYLCSSINFKDLCLLKYGNLKGDFLVFERAKTVRTKRQVEPIRVPLSDYLKDIIEKHGRADKNKENFIFPILTAGLSAERERQLIQQATQLVNDHIRIIASEIGIDKKITTYAARHSFSTILQRNGVPISFISEALGHTNVQTTQNYLGGFEDEAKVRMHKALTAFQSKDEDLGEK